MYKILHQECSNVQQSLSIVIDKNDILYLKEENDRKM